mmetsp:Transcript_1374/g.3177  ORF Transcript_1374/g.3177 Transcript_1374/m.3177 type:complete len:222 (-) Transcript_1374:142-807(-)
MYPGFFPANLALPMNLAGAAGAAGVVAAGASASAWGVLLLGVLTLADPTGVLDSTGVLADSTGVLVTGVLVADSVFLDEEGAALPEVPSAASFLGVLRSGVLPPTACFGALTSGTTSISTSSSGSAIFTFFALLTFFSLLLSTTAVLVDLALGVVAVVASSSARFFPFTALSLPTTAATTATAATATGAFAFFFPFFPSSSSTLSDTNCAPVVAANILCRS